MTLEKLTEILKKHKLWLGNEDGGKKASLSYANLSYANLSYANLSYANLSGANLSGAKLSGANLSYANLSYPRSGGHRQECDNSFRLYS